MIWHWTGCKQLNHFKDKDFMEIIATWNFSSLLAELLSSYGGSFNSTFSEEFFLKASEYWNIKSG